MKCLTLIVLQRVVVTRRSGEFLTKQLLLNGPRALLRSADMGSFVWLEPSGGASWIFNQRVSEMELPI